MPKFGSSKHRKARMKKFSAKNKDSNKSHMKPGTVKRIKKFEQKRAEEFRQMQLRGVAK